MRAHKNETQHTERFQITIRGNRISLLFMMPLNETFTYSIPFGKKLTRGREFSTSGIHEEPAVLGTDTSDTRFEYLIPACKRINKIC